MSSADDYKRHWIPDPPRVNYDFSGRVIPNRDVMMHHHGRTLEGADWAGKIANALVSSSDATRDYVDAIFGGGTRFFENLNRVLDAGTESSLKLHRFGASLRGESGDAIDKLQAKARNLQGAILAGKSAEQLLRDEQAREEEERNRNYSESGYYDQYGNFHWGSKPKGRNFFNWNNSLPPRDQ